MLENVQMSEAKNDLASPIYVCPIDPQIYQFVFVFFVKIRFSIVTFFTALPCNESNRKSFWELWSWRSFIVYDVGYPNVNNWLWTPFIERGEANRIYIEIKFSLRNCVLLSGTAL